MEKFSDRFSEYYDYLDNIRRRVYGVGILFFIFFVAGFSVAGPVIRKIVGFFGLEGVSIVTSSPFQFLDVATKIGAVTGIVFSLPLIAYHIYDFLKDGLNKGERRLFLSLLPASFFLFVGGFSYCFTILYFYLDVVSALNLSFGLHNIWDVGTFLSQIIIASTCLGVLFQFPIILTILMKLGVIKVEFLREKRFYAIAGIFLFVGFLPPPDVFSTLIQALPLVILYQMTIWLNSGKTIYSSSDIIEAQHEP